MPNAAARTGTDDPAFTLNETHSAKEFRTAHRWILPAMAVSTSDQAGFSRSERVTCRSVGKQSAVTRKKDNFACRNFPQVTAIDVYRVAWPDSRRHAAPGHTKAQSTEATNHLRRQTAANCI